MQINLAKKVAEKIKESAKNIIDIPELPTVEQVKKFDLGLFIRRNWLLILILLYMVSPFDFIPEFIFGPFGIPDDIGLLLFEIVRRAIMSANSKETDATPSPKAKSKS